MAQGVIYILTNPSFPEYVKIGYAAKLEERLRQLNKKRSDSICISRICDLRSRIKSDRCSIS